MARENTSVYETLSVSCPRITASISTSDNVLASMLTTLAVTSCPSADFILDNVPALTGEDDQ